MNPIEPVVTGYGLVEGPVWHPERGLLFCDVIFGGVFALKDKIVRTVFEHRRGIGGMAIHEAGGLIVSGKNISLKLFGQSESQLVLDRDLDNHNVGYNDLTTDSTGRVYVGSLGSSPVFDDGLEPRAGDLYLIDTDGASRVVASDVQLTNGLGFSADGQFLYHSDSRRQQVYRYRVHSNGDLDPREVFCEFEQGAPDGLAIAEDDSVWIANAGAGGVNVFNSDGSERAFIPISVPMCTSVCFGGEDLGTLYIVSGANGSGSERGGGVYSYQTDVHGLPVPIAKVLPL